MFLYDNGGGLDDTGRNMEGFTGGNFSPSPCRNLMAHPASHAPSAAYPSSEVAAGAGEPGKQCSPCAAVQGSASASISYGYFGGGGYYPCRMSRHHGAGGGVKTHPSPPLPHLTVKNTWTRPLLQAKITPPRARQRVCLLLELRFEPVSASSQLSGCSRSPGNERACRDPA